MKTLVLRRALDGESQPQAAPSGDAYSNYNEQSSPQLQEPRPYSREAEGTGGWLARQATRSGAQALSSTLGLPGNVSDIFGSLIEAASGYTPSQLIEKVGRDHPDAQFTPEEIEYGKYLRSQTPESERLDRAEPISLPKLPTSSDILSKAKEFFPEGYLEAEGPGEKFFDRLSTVAPAIVATVVSGGLAPAGSIGHGALTQGLPALVKGVTVAGAEQITEELGGGPLAQFLVGLSVGGVLSLMKHRGKTGDPKALKGLKGAKRALRESRLPEAEGDLRMAAKDAQNTIYDNIGKDAARAKIPVTKSLTEKVIGITADLEGKRSGLGAAALKKVKAQMMPIIEPLLHADKDLPASFFTESAKKLNSAWGEASGSPGSRTFFSRLKGVLEDEGLAILADQDPKSFGDNFLDGKALTKALHGGNEVVKDVESVLKYWRPKTWVVKELLQGGKWLFSGRDAPLMVKLIDIAPKEGMKYLGLIGLHAFAGDKKNLLRNIRNLDKIVEHRQKDSGLKKGGTKALVIRR